MMPPTLYTSSSRVIQKEKLTDMKRVIKNISSAMAAALVTVIMLNSVTGLMERKSGVEKYNDFFEQDENFDVLFFGTSHVMDAVFPMELYNDYGMVSYNFGNPSCMLATSYWTMENALDYTSPKLVVIDCYTLSNNTKTSDMFSFVHYSMDPFRLSVNKVKAVDDLLDDKNKERAVREGRVRQSDEKNTYIGLLWNYSVYHSRWSELTEDDFEPEYSVEKGAIAKIKVTPNEFVSIGREEKLDKDTLGVEYLGKMIEECKSRGIDVLLTYLPFAAKESKQREANRVYEIAEKYDVDYINFFDTDLVNYTTDCYDKASHLNVSGGRKITQYLGQYIKDNYGIEDRRGDESYSFWDVDLQEYQQFNVDNMRKEKKPDSYLMLISGYRADAVIDVSDRSIFKNNVYRELFKNCGVKEDELADNTDFIIIKNGGEKAVVLNGFKGEDRTIDTEAGTAKIKYTSSGKYEFYLDGSKKLTGSDNSGDDMKVVTYKKEKVESVKFKYRFNDNGDEIGESRVIR